MAAAAQEQPISNILIVIGMSFFLPFHLMIIHCVDH
jgi:hypothetical protein